VRWEEFSCEPGVADVRIVVSDYDDASVIEETTVPCSTLGYDLEDVARERYFVSAYLLDPSGEVYGAGYPSEVDLRNGISERVDMYFNGFSNFRIGWMFETGTCASNGADGVSMEIQFMGSPMFNFGFQDPCAFTPHYGSLPEGPHRIRLRAYHYTSDSSATVVAGSPSIDVTVVPEEIVDAGTVVLSPCDADCPD
jgi:hypothetical protein